MADSDCSPVLCMQHCTNQLNIFFTEFPEVCPICEASLKNCALLVPPFRLPSPFTPHSRAPRSFLVKPTTGSFLRDYRNGDYLHIGITLSDSAVVYNFDEDGLHWDSNGWEQCVAILPDIESKMAEDGSLWDTCLEEMMNSQVWTAGRYSADDNNCYDFVLSFLKKHMGGNDVDITREEFSRKYVVPAMAKPAKYIHIYRTIQECGTAIERYVQLSI